MSSVDDSYASIAEWYDLEHDPITEDVEAYASLIAEHAGDAAHVLEIGAGSGRVAAALAVAGHRVTAVEPSAPMRERLTHRLTQLPERAARRVTVVAGDAEAPGVATVGFDVALLGQNLLAHLPKPGQRLAALRATRGCLRPGGHLIADVDLLGPRRLLETAHQVWWQGAWVLASTGRPDDSAQVEHFVSGAPGASPGTVEVIHFYDVHTPRGSIARTTTRMTLALLSAGEVETALLASGFEIAAVYAGYDLAPYEEGAARTLVVAAAV